MLVSQGFDAALAGIFGLMLGSFLNVVVHRLPKMLERQWADECASLQDEAAAAGASSTPSGETEVIDRPVYNLAQPRSACPHCGHLIRWYENIPVLSYLALRGRCSACHKGISARYPVVEALTGALFAWCVWHWGLTPTGLVWCGFSAVLLSLALIDWDTTYLPDDLTQPLLWAGLIVAALGWNTPASTLHGAPLTLSAALWGAVAGYLSLWFVYQSFKLATGKEGMGYGDFKLFAALGAWFGWEVLIPIILLSSIAGAIVGVALKLRRSLREGGYLPFGPFLAAAGFFTLLYGPEATRRLVFAAF